MFMPVGCRGWFGDSGKSAISALRPFSRSDLLTLALTGREAAKVHGTVRVVSILSASGNSSQPFEMSLSKSFSADVLSAVSI